MTDPFKSIATLVEAKRTATVADLAAREIAKHCDARIESVRALIDEMTVAFRQIDQIAANMGHDTAAGRCGDIGRVARAALRAIDAARDATHV